MNALLVAEEPFLIIISESFTLRLARMSACYVLKFLLMDALGPIYKKEKTMRLTELLMYY